MKTTCFILTWALFWTTPLHGASTNDLASTFKQGLVEEEANRNLEAAIQAYQQVVVHFDKDRKTAATAIYRLGECYRKLGRTNEAVAQFERVVREFGDDELLVSISRNNLVALRGPEAATEPAARPGSPLSAAARAEQKKLFADEIKLAETELEILKKQQEVGRVEQTAVLAKERELLRLRRQAAGVDLPGDIPSTFASSVVTDEEGAEIRRIQQLVQNSPDLINAMELGSGKSPLHRAAERGQVTVVKYLLDHGASIDQLSPRKETALHLAAHVGQNAVVKLLLERKANVEARDNAGWTPLYYASSQGYRAVGETLLEQGANANARAGDGRTPLHTAADRGSLEFVQLLLQRGAKVDAADEAGTQPHMSAAASGNVAVLQALLEAGALMNATNRNGATALLFAVTRQHADAVQELLRRKADPHLPGFVVLARELPPGSRDGRTVLYPLEQAVELADVRITRLLLEAGAKPDLTVGKRLSPLWTAMAKKQFELVQILLEHKADPSLKDPLGHSLLTLAMRWQEAPEVLQLLLEAGLDANSPDPQFTTPLLRAVDSLWTDGARLLLQHGARVNVPLSFNGNTPLHLAVGHGSEVMVKLLLENKADVNLRNDKGETPLDLAKPARPSGVAIPGIAGAAAMPIPARPISAGPPRFDKASLEKTLREHGARDDLPRFDRITITRAAREFSQTVFVRQTNDWSHYTLLELLAVQYGVLAGSQSLGQSQSYERHILPNALVMNSLGGNARAALPYPDFSRVVIRRPKADGGGWSDLEVNAQAILEDKAGCRDVPLLWGDEVDVPEADHPVTDSWSYLNQVQLRGFVRCLTKRVQIKGKSETKTITLVPNVTFTENLAPEGLPMKIISNLPMTLHATLVNAKMVRTSSDLSRVKIRRKNPAAGAPSEWVTSSPVSATGADLWLDDGDEIEIPERPLF